MSRRSSPGFCSLAALFLAPLVGAIPSAATAPALIVVGSFMASAMGEIDWADFTVAIPAFLTMVMIPLTFSIANGLSADSASRRSLCSNSAVANSGKLNTVVYILDTAVSAARFYYMWAKADSRA